MRIGGIAFAVACLLVGQARAQQQGEGQAEPKKPARATGVETITVTAEKATSTLQETPLSINAFTTQDMENRGIFETEDIGNFSPGLNLKPANNSTNQLALVGRGFASADNDSLVPTVVGIYVDGVYLNTGMAASFDLMDIERIEVLKGPQGTLYGRNTLGGAINVTSVKPQPEWGGRFTLGYGTDNEQVARGSLNVPLLSERLFARISFLRRSRDPYYDNPAGDDYQDVDVSGGRAALRWLLTDRITADFSTEHIKIDNSIPAWALRTAGLAPQTPFITDEPDDVPNNGDLEDRTDIYQHTATLTWDVTENLELKSISGWRNWKFTGSNDLDGSPFTIYQSGQDDWHKTFYQEVQAVGSGMNGMVDYAVGGTWFDEEANSDKFTTGLITDSRNIQGDNYSWGLYGQSTFHVTDRLGLTGGLRYSHDRIEALRSLCFGNATNARLCPGGISAFVNDHRSTRFNDWSPLARVSYDWTDDIMTYVSWSKGYHSGRYGNRPSDGTDLSLNPVDEEKVYQWEVGWKTHFFDSRVQLNGSAFYSEAKDQQLTFFVPTGGGGTATVIANAGKSRIRGWEMELQSVPIDGLELRLGWGWTNSDLIEFIALDLDPLSPTFGTVADVADQNHLSIEPQRTYSAVATYTFPECAAGVFSVTGTFAWRGEQSFILNRRQADLQDQNSYGVFGARLLLADAFGWDGVSFSLTGLNLGDRVYRTNGVTFPFGAGVEWAGNTYGDPRHVLFELNYEY
jgi:iron complex outermembrane receptor protein